MECVTRCVWCALIIASGVSSYVIVTPPRSVSVGPGSDVMLGCEVRDDTPSEFIEWREFISTRQSGERIWISPDTGNIVHPNSTKYAVTGKFDLTVKGVTVYDGGRYSCGLLVAGSRHEAFISILEKPLCGVESTDVVEGEEVNITCHAGFGAEQRPELYFQDENNNRLTSIQIEEVYSTHLISSMNVTWRDDKREFECYSRVTGPSYSDNCSIALDVKYPVRNITFEPNESVFYVGEDLNCSTSGNPVPDITWTRISPPNGGIVRGQALPITSDMIAQPQHWKCTARNSVRSLSYVTEAHHNFTVVPAGTQPPSGVAATNHICLFLLLALTSLASTSR